MNLLKFVANFAIGGTERQFVNLSAALEPSRFAVRFGCLRLWGELLSEVEAHGFPIVNYDLCTFKHPRTVAAQMRLARDIHHNKIDVVHAYNYYAIVFAVPAAKLAGVPIVASIRDVGLHLSNTQILVQKYVCRLADHILVNATAIRDWLVADGYDPERITVIPNGIDLSRFEKAEPTGHARRAFDLPGDAPLVGMVSRVKPGKGAENFLRAAKIVRERFPNARFLVIGGSFTGGKTIVTDDEYLNQLKQLAAELGLEHSVVFTGFRNDVERIIPDLSAVVQPSTSEGLSNSLLESMAAAAPVVATTVGDAAEVVRDGENGFLIPPEQPEAMAERVSMLLSDRNLASRVGAAARRSVVARFTIPRMVESTSTFYESLLARA